MSGEPNLGVAWKYLAEASAELLDCEPGRGGRALNVPVQDWILCLEGGWEAVQVRAIFVNPAGLRLTLNHRRLFGLFGPSVDRQHLPVGDPGIDGTYLLRSNDAPRAQALFGRPGVRQRIAELPALRLVSVRDESRLGPQFPLPVDELLIEVAELRLNARWLAGLLGLTTEILRALRETDPAPEDEAGAAREILLGAGGKIRSGELLIWDGTPLRRRATECLGRLRDPRAVMPLLTVTRDPDPGLRAAAAAALGEIGDGSAAPFLIPLLADSAPAAGAPVRDAAALALRKLGEAEAVDWFLSVPRGGVFWLSPRLERFRRDFADAFLRLFEDADLRTSGYLARALARLGWFAALPQLRNRLREHVHLGFEVERPVRMIDEAIRTLERQVSYPLPAAPPAPDPGPLPRPAGAPGMAADQLPIPSGEPDRDGPG